MIKHRRLRWIAIALVVLAVVGGVVVYDEPTNMFNASANGRAWMADVHEVLATVKSGSCVTPSGNLSKIAELGRLQAVCQYTEDKPATEVVLFLQSGSQSANDYTGLKFVGKGNARFPDGICERHLQGPWWQLARFTNEPVSEGTGCPSGFAFE